MRTLATLFTILFCYVLIPEAIQAQTVQRGPYLQNVTSSSVTIRWRTNISNIGSVDFGTALGALSSSVSEGAATTEHEVRLTGLSPNTRYFYQLKAGTTGLAGNDADHYLDTAPLIGSSGGEYTAWFLGDCGTADANAARVRDAFYNVAGRSDLMIFLGDNAYNVGTDAEYQGGVFDMYPAALRNTVAYSCPGNHEFFNGSTDSPTQAGPYYDIFTHPTAAEGGGLASGTEAYYSFDYGNIHFVSLDSYDMDRSIGGAMYNWLQNDLSNTTQDWIVAFFHHNPYTKGSHNSDTEIEHFEMRQNFAPLLELHGVDLVLSGHSHSYERSMLVNGHYGVSSTFNAATHVVTSGNGDKMGRYAQAFGSSLPLDCAYVKNGDEGAVYIVAGSSGKVSGGTFNHPVHIVNLMKLGSTFLKVDGNRLDVSFIQDTEEIGDVFTIFKNIADPSTACTSCATAGTPCDDNDAATVNDIIDAACNCTGEAICGTTIINRAIQNSLDDVEESNIGWIYTNSSDLELIDDPLAGGNGLGQTVGLRFDGLTIPPGAIITNAYLQFQVDEEDAGTTNLLIAGEDTNHSIGFTTTAFDVSNRTTTTATVAWNAIPVWTPIGAAGLDQRTPDVSTIVQEIVNRTGWSSGNAMSFILTGAGERTATSFDGGGAPILHIEYRMGICISPKVFLQGPYNGTDMNADLSTASLLPVTEPYSALGHSVQNTGVAMSSSATSLTGNDKIVDWVLVELRNPSTTIIASTAALLQKDGDVVGMDGTSFVYFEEVIPGNYYIVVQHRNHLGVMTAVPINVN